MSCPSLSDLSAAFPFEDVPQPKPLCKPVSHGSVECLLELEPGEDYPFQPYPSQPYHQVPRVQLHSTYTWGN